MSFSILGVFFAGLLTFLSPCVLPLAPILITNLLSLESPTRFDRFKATLWFCIGFSFVFVLLGLSLPSVTNILGGVKPLLLALGGVIFAGFGLRMMGFFGNGRIASLLSRSFHLPAITSKLPKGLHGVCFGALFGLSWTPCVGPILGGVLTYVASQEISPLRGAFYLGAFALGISLPLLALAVGSDYATPFFGKLKRHLPKIEYAAGLGLFLFGIFIVNQSRLSDFTFRKASDQSLSVVDDQNLSIRLGEGKAQTSRMIFFYSEHCPICHQMASYLPAFEKTCSSAHFELVKVNVDHPENYQAVSHFDVRAVPTISVLNSKGDEMVHLVGYQTESRLRDAARTVTQFACAKQDTPNPSLENALPIAPDQEQKDSCQIGVAC